MVDKVGIFVPYKFGFGHILTKFNAAPAKVTKGFTGSTGPLTLLLHQLLESTQIQGHPLLLKHFDGKIHGKAVGVVEFKGVCTGKGVFSFGFVLGQQVTEYP